MLGDSDAAQSAKFIASDTMIMVSPDISFEGIIGGDSESTIGELSDELTREGVDRLDEFSGRLAFDNEPLVHADEYSANSACSFNDSGWNPSAFISSGNCDVDRKSFQSMSLNRGLN